MRSWLRASRIGKHYATPAMPSFPDVGNFNDRETRFLLELAELSKKYGLELESTDACLIELREPDGRYVISRTRAAITWVNELPEGVNSSGDKGSERL